MDSGLAASRRPGMTNAMQWTDEAIVLGVKRHGETSVILELMTQERGRHLGLVRGGAGTRLRGVLQPGNSLRATWRARLDEHLGHYAVEGINLRAAGFLGARTRFTASRIFRLCAACLPSASRMRASMGRWKTFSTTSTIRALPATLIARFELAFLAELGFGLDLAVLRGNRNDCRSHLCVAAIGPRGLARRRRGVSRQAVAAAAFLRSGRRVSLGSRSCRCVRAHRIFSRTLRLRAARPCHAARAQPRSSLRLRAR